MKSVISNRQAKARIPAVIGLAVTGSLILAACGDSTVAAELADAQLALTSAQAELAGLRTELADQEAAEAERLANRYVVSFAEQSPDTVGLGNSVTIGIDITDEGEPLSSWLEGWDALSAVWEVADPAVAIIEAGRDWDRQRLTALAVGQTEVTATVTTPDSVVTATATITVIEPEAVTGVEFTREIQLLANTNDIDFATINELVDEDTQEGWFTAAEMVNASAGSLDFIWNGGFFTIPWTATTEDFTWRWSIADGSIARGVPTFDGWGLIGLSAGTTEITISATGEVTGTTVEATAPITVFAGQQDVTSVDLSAFTRDADTFDRLPVPADNTVHVGDEIELRWETAPFFREFITDGWFDPQFTTLLNAELYINGVPWHESDLVRRPMVSSVSGGAGGLSRAGSDRNMTVIRAGEAEFTVTITHESGATVSDSLTLTFVE